MTKPRHALTEGKDLDFLCFNSLLPFLSRLLELGAFRNHSTIESLLAVKPPKHTTSCHIHWKDHILDTPFFESQALSRAGKIERAEAFGRRMKNLGIRAGMPEPPTQHDWRAEGLFKTAWFSIPRVLKGIIIFKIKHY
ncbi:hypothetical protein AYL99_11903 [Fonsecaea erecta]|uniref:Uncharacterized protein n=1 Tax=Fonsecaea erecta TaxID=1367422 RepID=A0A178Z2Z3_9EURO|nr:hypothetical protein AYL99_11903 [Fonsecaea erecta]OAP53881.1 hypothetical protein AYL99_11903 [Fonsecaea erecta]